MSQSVRKAIGISRLVRQQPHEQTERSWQRAEQQTTNWISGKNRNGAHAEESRNREDHEYHGVILHIDPAQV